MLSDCIAEFLSHLELIEVRLLTWGVVDGAFDEHELFEIGNAFLVGRTQREEWEDGAALVDELIDRRLLFRFLEGSKARLRTRMAETVRLLSRLRQLFPNHLNDSRWQQAKTLVADYRLLIRPRQFPQRGINLDEAITDIDSVTRLTPLQRDILSTILSSGGRRSLQLSGFQMRATRRVLSEAEGRNPSGSIVCSGTGSGKTLAFYLPAFLQLCPTLDSSRWTRCLAIYPRNELLKDQLLETFRQTRRIESTLKRHGLRKLTIGTLFSATPSRRSFDTNSNINGWTRRHNGFICPFLRCPEEHCSGELVWSDTDREKHVERLKCIVCGTMTDHDSLILTRERLLDEPADILFTTTEMLNQRLGDSRYGRLFGVGRPDNQRPPLVLLDEVHTYSGKSGAQVAMLLRRWRYMARTRPHFVGLSATLANASRFFAQLIGCEPNNVEEIAPYPDELVHSGMEYMIALRGDPASGASLLSTTIQSAMLLRRVLDTSQRFSGGLYGTREFVFGDDLDVINRLYFNLLDAEAVDVNGRPLQSKPGGSLANLRSTMHQETGQRMRQGQAWKLSEDIGHPLQPTTSLRIDRTTSQDVGVVGGADIVVASASLEVGFNDPEVGVVLQHKSPRDPAQFLQRKGRAGRRVEMRPWTAVVLSDYGRDRLTWQSYELLFDPELAPRSLPTSNRYVLRMQCVNAFMDWMGQQLRRQSTLPMGNIWQDFAVPSHMRFGVRPSDVSQRQKAAAKIVEELLTSEDRREDLSKWLQETLHQSPDVITSLMWEPPRALMTAVLPTLLRRLQTGWRRASSKDSGGENLLDYHALNHPLPEFVPGQLFSDLTPPEVTVVIPPQRTGEEPKPEPLPIVQALREFAPGRVSKRFAVSHHRARHWISPVDPVGSSQQSLPIDRYLSRYDELGDFQYRSSETDEVRSVRCLRPYELRPAQPAQEIQDTSNAFLVWRTQIVPTSEGVAVDIPAPSAWEPLVREIQFFTHSHNLPVEVRRFAIGSDASIVRFGGDRFDISIDFVAEEECATRDGLPPDPVAVGFAADVDGVVFRVALPKFDEANASPELLRGLRATLFQDLVVGDATLDGVANRFQRQWLAEVYLAAIAGSAIASGRPLQEVWAAGHEEGFDRVLQVVFQSIPVASDSRDDAGALPIEELHQKLYHDLHTLLHNSNVVAAIRRHAPVLWQSSDSSWTDWLNRKFQSTLGSALLEAVQLLCQDFNSDELLLDIDPGPRAPGSTPLPDGLVELWLTENTVGGGGIIENFLIRYGEDPRRFFDLVESALRPSDFEIVDDQLTMLLELMVAQNDSETIQLVREVRQAASMSHSGHSMAFRRLMLHLSQRGLFMCHPVVAAMATRILRPGSGVRTDRALHELTTRWKQQEASLGIEIDLRVFASLQAQDDTLDEALADFNGEFNDADRGFWRFGALTSTLWPRGASIRSRRLSVYNPYTSLPAPEHDLVRSVLPTGVPVVDIGSTDWRESAERHLVQDAVVELRSALLNGRHLREAILLMLVQPVDAGYLLLCPRVRRVERGPQFIGVVLELAEGRQ